MIHGKSNISVIQRSCGKHLGTPPECDLKVADLHCKGVPLRKPIVKPKPTSTRRNWLKVSITNHVVTLLMVGSLSYLSQVLSDGNRPQVGRGVGGRILPSRVLISLMPRHVRTL